MHRALATWSVLSGLLTAAPSAWAGGSVSPSPFATPPAIDDGAIPDAARHRPSMPDGRRHPVEARLIAADATVAPGATTQVGVHLLQDDDWHTYWQSPGDIGLVTEIDWTLPEGVTLAPRTWPVPQRFELEGIVSYGYDHGVLHAFDLTIPADAPAGRLPVEARVSWLVCKQACIPGEADLRTELVVAGETGPGPHAAAFAHWRTRWPSDDPALTVTAAACDAAGPGDDRFAVAFALAGADGAPISRQGVGSFPAFAAIPGHPDRMVNEADVTVAEDGGQLLIGVQGTAFGDAPATDDPGVGGLVQVKVGDHDVRAEIATPMPWGALDAPDPHGPCRVFEDGPVAEPSVAEQDAALAEALGEPAALPAGSPPSAAAATSPLLVLSNLLFAFLGGLLLNIMPCVLPVLALKLYGLVEQADLSDGDKRQAGVVYTLGILMSFWALAGGVLVARAALGGGVGWGFQFQEPAYVAFLAAIVFLFALNLFGVFEVPALGGDKAHALQGKEGPAGYFFTGVFATLVATPCSAPFLGTAIAFAFQASFGMLLVIFTMIGLGLASPFLLVAFVPAAYRLLPTPGPWMESFKQLMGFTLVATAVWLVGVLGSLVGHDRLVGYLAFLTIVALGAWILGRWADVGASTRQKWTALLAASSVVALGGWRFVDLEVLPPETCGPVGEIPVDLDYAAHIPWQDFSPERVAGLAGRTVFLDFTADWCLTCKINEATVLETSAVRDAMAAHRVVPLQGDWTRRDPVLTAWLERFGRAGVPMYVVIPPSGLADAILLPEVITPGLVTDAIERAAAMGPVAGR